MRGERRKASVVASTAGEKGGALDPLQELMNPSSIAFYGASNNPLKMGTMQLANILEGGYGGRVYPIHPSEEKVMGLPAYRSIAEVKERVDLVQMVLPPDLVPRIMEECGKCGVKRAIVISGGFKETLRREGESRERELKRIAEKHGIRFLGPNCVGIMNGLRSLNTTTIPEPPFGGGIAIVSQSGAYTSMLNPYLREQGMRICQTISVGNEADIDLVDCLGYLEREEAVTAVGLYVETIRRPRDFIASARRVAARKPVLAVYVGGNEAGARSSLSHTGAVAGPDEMYDGIFRQAGVMRAEDMDHMMDMLWALSTQPLLRGERMAVVTNSGGPGTSLAYHLEKAGLSVPVFSTGLQSRLREITTPTASLMNPLDVTFDPNLNVYRDILEVVFSSGEVDGALLYGVFGPSDMSVNLRKRFPQLIPFEKELEELHRRSLAELAAIPSRHGRPLVVMSLLGSWADTRRTLVEAGIPVFHSASRAARAVRALLDYSRLRERLSVGEGIAR